MQSEISTYVLLAGLAIALLWVIVTDLKSRTISNRLTMAVALCAPVFWLSTGLPLWPGVALQIGLAAIVFAVCCILFAIRQMGSGDVKLLSALALWIPPMAFLKLLLVMSLIGGVLTLVLAMWHFTVTRRRDAKIPYGVAIASAGLITLFPQLEAGWRTVTGA